MLANITIQKPDLCHDIGQSLLLPVSVLFGRSYLIENGNVHAVRAPSLLMRVIAVAMSILIFPITFMMAGVGALLLKCSTTYKTAYEQVQKQRVDIVWKEGKPEIRTERLLLRPVQPDDYPVYQRLFSNAVAMQRVVGGPRDITARFNGWVARWKEHSFSALAVVDKDTGKVIGHTVMGHGDYEGNFDKGWSEMARVIDPAYWNADHPDAARGIGTAGKKGIGTEVLRAVVAYAKALKERGVAVPSDVEPAQRAQLVANYRPDIRYHLNAQGAIDWVYLPFTQLVATSHQGNPGSYRSLTQVFVKENKGEVKPKNAQRDLFTLQLA